MRSNCGTKMPHEALAYKLPSETKIAGTLPPVCLCLIVHTINFVFDMVLFFGGVWALFTFEDQFCVLVLSFYLIDCVMKYSFPSSLCHNWENDNIIWKICNAYRQLKLAEILVVSVFTSGFLVKQKVPPPHNSLANFSLTRRR